MIWNIQLLNIEINGVIGCDTEEYSDGLRDKDEELSELEGGYLYESLKTRVEGEMKELANAE